jgi:hypothetical protein
MTSKSNDLNPKNTKYNEYKAKVLSAIDHTANKQYQDKPFAEEYSAIYIASSLSKIVASVVSGATILVSVYLATKPLLGSFVAVCIALLFCVLFESIKGFLWSITAKNLLKYKTVSKIAISMLIGLHLVSIAGSCFGAWKIPTLIVQQKAKEPALINIDSISKYHSSQIGIIDAQILAMQSKKDRSTNRETTKILTEQKTVALDDNKRSIESAKYKNKVIVKEHKESVLNSNLAHLESLFDVQIASVGLAMFFELVFVLCAIFISFYLFRAFIDSDDSITSSEQASVKSTLEANTNGSQRPIEPSDKNRAVIVGFKQHDGKRQELEYTRICLLEDCQKPYIHSIHNQKYCCEDCRKEAYVKRKVERAAI